MKACQQLKTTVAFAELRLLFGLTLLSRHGGSNEKADSVRQDLEDKYRASFPTDPEGDLASIKNRLMTVMYEEARVRGHNPFIELMLLNSRRKW